MQEHATKATRRVYAPELRDRLGVGETWLRRLETTGRIPPGRTDPGGKRKFWLEEEIEPVIRGVRSTESAVPV